MLFTLKYFTILNAKEYTNTIGLAKEYTNRIGLVVRVNFFISAFTMFPG